MRTEREKMSPQAMPTFFNALYLGSSIVAENAFENATYQISIGIDTTKGMTQDAVIALFPKYCKAKKSGVGCNITNADGEYVYVHYDTVVLNVSIDTNAVTGEVNETGLKRRLKTLEILNKNFSHLLCL